jgi:predicted cobalt transporter CbtA
MSLAIEVVVAMLVIAGFSAAMWTPIVMYLRREHQRDPSKNVVRAAVRFWATVIVAGAGLALIAFVAVLMHQR